MPLATGTRLGNYEIVDPLGADGVGEGYAHKTLWRAIRRAPRKATNFGFADPNNRNGV
jgi:hypothetical protein